VPLLAARRQCKLRHPIRQVSSRHATQTRQCRLDGAPQQSLHQALLTHIGTKGLTIQEMMIRVRKSVMQSTNNAQVPWGKQP